MTNPPSTLNSCGVCVCVSFLMQDRIWQMWTVVEHPQMWYTYIYTYNFYVYIHTYITYSTCWFHLVHLCHHDFSSFSSPGLLLYRSWQQPVILFHGLDDLRTNPQLFEGTHRDRNLRRETASARSTLKSHRFFGTEDPSGPSTIWLFNIAMENPL